MSDIPVNQEFMVPVQDDVKRKWLEVMIQEKRSRIVRLKQDMEDLIKGQYIKLEGHLIMLNRELSKLEKDWEKMTPIETENIEKEVQDG